MAKIKLDATEVTTLVCIAASLNPHMFLKADPAILALIYKCKAGAKIEGSSVSIDGVIITQG